MAHSSAANIVMLLLSLTMCSMLNSEIQKAADVWELSLCSCPFFLVLRYKCYIFHLTLGDFGGKCACYIFRVHI